MAALSRSGRDIALTHPVVCIVGPTASGKSDVSQLLAQRIGAEIVSADSMQIYRGMDIGTGKVLPPDRVVPHFGLDLIAPGESYSAALFQDYARECFNEIERRGNRCVLCGGTGFYVRAAIDDYRFPEGEQVNNEIRDHYNALADELGYQAIWDILREKDPMSAACIHPRNVKRVIRALEMHAAGESYAIQAENLKSIPQLVPAVFFGLHVDPDVLRKRINARVDSMVSQGLIEEVRLLLDNGFREGITAPQAIGYKEIVAALDGETTMDEAIECIKASTRKYAKRQRSWFRQDKRISWIESTHLDFYEIADSIEKQL